jgi:lysophospholipase L1-like esterase
MEPEKPLVFVIGDSISQGYGPPLAEMLADRFRCARKGDDDAALGEFAHLAGANAEDSTKVLAYLNVRLQDADFAPEIMLLNCGLHDLRVWPQTGSVQVLLSDYQENLRAMARLIQDRDIRLVWVRITPVDDERHNRLQSVFQRSNADVERYNAIADGVFAKASCPIIDLYTFTAKLGDDLYADHVHFKPHVQRLQAAFIAGFLRGLSA